MSDKERLDVLLVELGYYETREKARAQIMAGKIYVDDQKSDKPGTKVSRSANIEDRGEKMPFVSRGGFKLDKAVRSFKIDLKEKICLDIGASTGGFTDVMLQSGAQKVYAVDVGYGQFAWKLRTDPRVVCLERMNFRYATKEEIQDPIDFAATDVSFISITKIIPAAIRLMKEDGEMVALIKPQFEAGREKVEKKGVVRKKSTHKEVLKTITDFVTAENLFIYGLDYSPIKGPEGNIEFLIYFGRKDKEILFDYESVIDELIDRAHSI
ncbi:TlyA family RNA methyltransferase [Proteiniclasticum sp.]|uniref:TlyA family RNA methyltransferase n=1 Tax=Proteiniclasticum sp. TaxID=2053595 RepID=UPI00289F3968|nr:TlyA family RNA methyltransferase [Proteiniclasticum sp.]